MLQAGFSIPSFLSALSKFGPVVEVARQFFFQSQISDYLWLVLIFVFCPGLWETRILIAPCGVDEAKLEGDVVATAAQERAGVIWYALTPELDIYPHVLEVGPNLLTGIVAFDSEGWTDERRLSTITVDSFVRMGCCLSCSAPNKSDICLFSTGVSQLTDHDPAMRKFEMVFVFDQANVSEHAAYELIARLAQMVEWRRRDRVLGRSKDVLFDDQFLYMGTGEKTRGPADARDIRPYSDQALVRDRAGYAGSTADLHRLGLVAHGKSWLQRLLGAPSMSATAPSSTWPGRADVDNTFYQIELAPGMRDPFAPPAAHGESLIQALGVGGKGLAAGARISPLLIVLPMGGPGHFICAGVSWGNAHLMQVAPRNFIRDRRLAPSLCQVSMGTGVCVDNVAVVSQGPSLAVAACEQIANEMESVGLACKGASQPRDGQAFAGMVSEKKNATIRMSAFRIWKTRLALLLIADRGADRGGFGATELERGPEAAERAMMAQSERWRCGVSSAISARASALGLQVVGGRHRGAADFVSVPEDLVGDERARKEPAQQPGLTALHFEKVGHRARRNFQREWDEFRQLCQERGVTPHTVEQVNTMAHLYLDARFFAGYNRDRAGKLRAARRHFLPKAGIGDHGEMEAALAAMKGDLLQLTGASLVPPARLGGQALRAAGVWALLLRPEEQPLRGKAGQFDEGAALATHVSLAIGRRMQQLKFRALFRALGHDSARPCQVRHGAASAAEGHRALAATWRRLRHAAGRSSKRCAKHARCLSELAFAPLPTLSYGRLASERLAEVISGKAQLAPPDFDGSGPLKAGAGWGRDPAMAASSSSGKWKTLAVAGGGVAVAAALLYVLRKASGAAKASGEGHEAAQAAVAKPKLEEVTKEEARSQEIIVLQDQMKAFIKKFTDEMVSNVLTFEQTYLRVKQVHPPDPLVKYGLSTMDFDQLLEKHQNDPKVREAIAKIMGAPTQDSCASSHVQAITVPKIKEIHAFLLAELETVLGEFEKLPNKDTFDLKTVTIAAQAIVNTKIREKFDITSEDGGACASAPLPPQAFTTLNIKIQHIMGKLMGTPFSS
ncbi:unnamed protein product [Prorocentrum cordatum]|uniref:Uncharacterized protein n=1 Tax=Prorocentrum cordatum TaxID=2364126 RepID=A0ABN9XZB0_9DINO|nr:unnamed protein product [Polarella glacialis]